jgi:hypothetical protein
MRVNYLGGCSANVFHYFSPMSCESINFASAALRKMRGSVTPPR